MYRYMYVYDHSPILYVRPVIFAFDRGLIAACMRFISLKFDDLSSRPGRERPPNREIDSVFEEADASIHQ